MTHLGKVVVRLPLPPSKRRLSREVCAAGEHALGRPVAPTVRWLVTTIESPYSAAERAAIEHALAVLLIVSVAPEHEGERIDQAVADVLIEGVQRQIDKMLSELATPSA